MNHFIKTLLAFLAVAFMLSSCSGIRPLYGANSDIKRKLQSIEIAETSTILGAEIYHQLDKLLETNGESRYLLRINTLSSNTAPILLTNNSNVLKQNIEQQYEYILTDNDTNKEVNRGKIRIVGSYDSSGESYVSYTNERFLKKDLSREVASEIYMRLLLFFES